MPARAGGASVVVVGGSAGRQGHRPHARRTLGSAASGVRYREEAADERQADRRPGLGLGPVVWLLSGGARGGLLFLAGQMPVNRQAQVVGAGDIRAQTRQTFENLKAVLAAAGSSLDDLVELVSYHTDMADLPGVMEVKGEYIPGDFPAWTAVGVSALALPGQLIEVKAVAVAR